MAPDVLPPAYLKLPFEEVKEIIIQDLATLCDRKLNPKVRNKMDDVIGARMKHPDEVKPHLLSPFFDAGDRNAVGWRTH